MVEFAQHTAAHVVGHLGGGAAAVKRERFAPAFYLEHVGILLKSGGAVLIRLITACGVVRVDSTVVEAILCAGESGLACRRAVCGELEVVDVRICLRSVADITFHGNTHMIQRFDLLIELGPTHKRTADRLTGLILRTAHIDDQVVILKVDGHVIPHARVERKVI